MACALKTTETESCQCDGDVTCLDNLDNVGQFVVLTSCGLLLQKGASTVRLYICSSHFSKLLEDNENKRKKSYCVVPLFLSAHQTIDHSIFKSSQLPLQHRQNYGGKKKFKKGNWALKGGQIESIRKNTGFTLPVGTRK